MKTIEIDLNEQQAAIVSMLIDREFAAAKPEVITEAQDRHNMYPVIAAINEQLETEDLDWSESETETEAEAAAAETEADEPASATQDDGEAKAEPKAKPIVNEPADASYGDGEPGILYDSAGNRYECMLLPGHVADLEEDGCTAFDFGNGKVQAYAEPPKQPEAKSESTTAAKPEAELVKIAAKKIKHEATGLEISLSEKSQALIKADAAKTGQKWKTDQVLDVYARSVAGQTIEEIAKANKMPVGTVGSWIQGRSRPGMFGVLLELREAHQAG